jgi:hypothetical protein
VPCQAPAASTAPIVRELKAQSEEESHNTFDQRLAVAKELQGGGLVVNIDGDGPMFASVARGVAHRSPSGQMVVATDYQSGGKTEQLLGNHEGCRGSTTSCGGMGNTQYAEAACRMKGA